MQCTQLLTLSDDELEELEKIEEKWDNYNQLEASIKAQILTTIPKSIAFEIQGLPTGKAIWDALCDKYEKKVLTVIVDLRCRIYVLKCMDEANVRNHIYSLSMMYEQLKGMGETITNGDFTTLILGSLPKTYRSLINTISLQNCTSATPLKPKIIMESILEEFD